MSSNEDESYSVDLTIPFENKEFAKIAANSIDADEVPNPDIIARTISTCEKNLAVHIESNDLFKLRTSLNNFIEAILQIKKTIVKFKPVE